MKVAVIGTGFVGVVTAAVWAKLGHIVTGLDRHQDKINGLKLGKAWFYEPGLDELLQVGLKQKNLRFTIDYGEAISGSEVVAICVGTPSAKNGTADLTYVFQAAETMVPFLADKAIVVIKSTVPPGTNRHVAELIAKKTDKKFFLASVPEFLREGKAVADTLKPDRVVIGANDTFVINKLLKLHEGLEGERVVVSPESAQMAKYTANAYLAQRITFINQIANLCERNGARISEVIRVIGRDNRIGPHYWYPGLGYGGSCFPKDVKELAAYARSIGEGQGLLPKIDELNEERLKRKLNEYGNTIGGFRGKQVAVLGLSFKPNTTDTREAPSLKVIPYLLTKGAKVRVYDPRVKTAAGFAGVTVGTDAYQACDKAEVVVVLIEWPEIAGLDLKKLSQVTAPGAWLVDTRNIFNQERAEADGLRYIGIGNN